MSGATLGVVGSIIAAGAIGAGVIANTEPRPVVTAEDYEEWVAHIDAQNANDRHAHIYDTRNIDGIIWRRPRGVSFFDPHPWVNPATGQTLGP